MCRKKGLLLSQLIQSIILVAINFKTLDKVTTVDCIFFLFESEHGNKVFWL